MIILGNLLRLLGIYVVYPAIVVGLFLSLGYYIYKLVKQAREMEKIRRIAGALLPIVGLVFILVLTNPKTLDLSRFYGSLSNPGGLILGFIIGITIILLGNYLRESDLEILPSVYTLYLSSIAVFVLYAIIRFKLGDLNYFLMGMVVGAGAIIVWKGIPDAMLAEQYNPWIVKGKEHHRDIARKYLSREVGLSPDEIEYIMANTGFIPTLTAGNYVFNYYVDGVYFSAVTRGDASISPSQALSTADRLRLHRAEGLSAEEYSALTKRVPASLQSGDTSPARDGLQHDSPEDKSDTGPSMFKRLEQW